MFFQADRATKVAQRAVEAALAARAEAEYALAATRLSRNMEGKASLEVAALARAVGRLKPQGVKFMYAYVSPSTASEVHQHGI